MPRTAFALVMLDGFWPSRVSIVIGIWIAIEWTFSAAVPSTPLAVGSGIRCASLNGRRAPRSKIEPRST